MVDYIEQQWLALLEGWGGLLCRDLRLLLLTWLNQDADVGWVRSCTLGLYCQDYKSGCWRLHVRQPERADLRVLAVQTNAWALGRLRREHRTAGCSPAGHCNSRPNRHRHWSTLHSNSNHYVKI